MTCGNPVKHKLQKVIDNWLDMFSVERKLSDEQMECMQFGICDYAPRQVEEVPFFHYLILLARVKYLFYFTKFISNYRLSIGRFINMRKLVI